MHTAELVRTGSMYSDLYCDCILMVNCVTSASYARCLNDWIMDSGVTCHMSLDEKLFLKLTNGSWIQE